MEDLSVEKGIFHTFLFSWWQQNKRTGLPWRKTQDPYKIMIAEVALQQTQVTRVIPKYIQFIGKFPTLETLAAASTASIIRAWQGLGYNRRSIWLQEAAKQILDWGLFPLEPRELLKLKGIGPYTSKSIPIFAGNLDFAAVDSNIRRVLIHHHFVEQNMSMKEIQGIADNLVPKGKSRDYHNALMDYGAAEITTRKTGIRPINIQPTFKGSNREIRGLIIKTLVNSPSSLQEIRREFGLKKVDRIIHKLEKEGLIVKVRKSYQLPN